MEIKLEMVEVHLFKIVDGDLKYLILKRSENEIFPGLWQMVTGKIECGEKAYETAIREIKEETGLIPKKLWVVPNINSFYSQADDCISLLPVFAAQLSSSCSVKISEEHCEYKWVSSKEAKKLFAWEGQRKSVDIIENYFVKEKNFLDLVEVVL
ncbi:MAG: NUDIX pyrophosphatase [Ignavibacteria bacterium CG2_30_36_16]|nr:NUDIX domain-containing protein [Ignavibacteria bacterium]OIP55816.1 MAG: NUDIX pyrophosphatase [Ignavibacteria bacterium CG2_30_36_16]